MAKSFFSRTIATTSSTTRRAAAQEVASCCTDNIALGSPVELQPLRPVPGLALQSEWVERLTAAMHAGLPLYRA